jgi:hypothetical protein
VIAIDSVGLPAVGLLHDVLEEHLVRCIAEVDDHVGALPRAELHLLHREGLGQQPAVAANPEKRAPVAEPDTVVARGRSVQEPEPILAPLHAEEGLRDAVDDGNVADASVVI